MSQRQFVFSFRTLSMQANYESFRDELMEKIRYYKEFGLEGYGWFFHRIHLEWETRDGRVHWIRPELTKEREQMGLNWRNDHGSNAHLFGGFKKEAHELTKK